MCRISLATSCCAFGPYRLRELPRLLREELSRFDDEADLPRELRVRVDEDRRDEPLPARPDVALRPFVDFFAVLREADFLAAPLVDVFRAEPPDDLPLVDFFAALFRAPPLRERELFADFLVAIGTSLLAFQTRARR